MLTRNAPRCHVVVETVDEGPPGTEECVIFPCSMEQWTQLRQLYFDGTLFLVPDDQRVVIERTPSKPAREDGIVPSTPRGEQQSLLEHAPHHAHAAD